MGKKKNTKALETGPTPVSPLAAIAERIGRRLPPTEGLGISPPLPPIKSALDLPPGFYVMPAITGQGKTISAAAIVKQSKELGCKARFRSTFEPGCDDVIDMAYPANWSAMVKRELGIHRGGLVVFDSMHFAMALMPEVAALEATLGSMTFKDGVRMLEFFGAALYNSLAIAANVTFIGTFNSDVFPTATKLEASCAGSITITTPGQLNVRARGVQGRDSQVVTLDKDIVTAVALEIHGARKKSASFGRI